jgi:CheY-like chemotaxis protein
MHACDDHLRLLLVDDMEALRFALGGVLRLYGFDVCEAVDGRDALERINRFRPQLVLTDLMMPVMDGVELIRHLIAAPETASIPILVLTANTTDEAADSAREAGAIEVFAKPVDLPHLVRRLREVSYSPASSPADLALSDSLAPRSSGLGTCAPRLWE